MDSVVQAIGFAGAVLGGLVLVYVTARLIALAWHNTKAEYDRKLFREIEGEYHGSEEKEVKQEDQH